MLAYSPTLSRPVATFALLGEAVAFLSLLFQSRLLASAQADPSHGASRLSERQIVAEWEIVKQAQRDPRRFAPLYERYYEPIFIFVNRRLDDEESSAELTAQTFYKALRNLSRLQYQGAPFSAWLFKVALNEVNGYFRKRYDRERAVSLKSEHIEVLAEELEGEEGEDRQALVVKLLASLGSDELAFLELRFFEGRSFREIGYLLGLSEGNAKVKTYRLLAKLKKRAQSGDYD